MKWYGGGIVLFLSAIETKQEKSDILCQAFSQWLCPKEKYVFSYIYYSYVCIFCLLECTLCMFIPRENLRFHRIPSIFFCFASAQYPFKPNFIFHTSTQIYWYVFWILIWMIELSWIVCGCYFFLISSLLQTIWPISFGLALAGRRFVDFVKSFTGWNVMQIESTIFSQW